MESTDRTSVAIGVEIHREFGTVTARKSERKIAGRQRLEQGDRLPLRRERAFIR